MVPMYLFASSGIVLITPAFLFHFLLEPLQVILILTLSYVICLSHRWTGFLFFFLAYQIHSVVLCRKSFWTKRLEFAGCPHEVPCSKFNLFVLSITRQFGQCYRWLWLKTGYEGELDRRYVYYNIRYLHSLFQGASGWLYSFPATLYIFLGLGKVLRLSLVSFVFC